MKNYKITDANLRVKFDKDTVHDYSFVVQWSSDMGFGIFQFTVGEDGKVYIDNECMGKEFIKAVLCKMVDDAILADPRD